MGGEGEGISKPWTKLLQSRMKHEWKDLGMQIEELTKSSPETLPSCGL